MRASRVFTWKQNLSYSKEMLSMQRTGWGEYHDSAACRGGCHETVERRERQPHHDTSDHREDVAAMVLEPRWAQRSCQRGKSPVITGRIVRIPVGILVASEFADKKAEVGAENVNGAASAVIIERAYQVA